MGVRFSHPGPQHNMRANLLHRETNRLYACDNIQELVLDSDGYFKYKARPYGVDKIIYIDINQVDVIEIAEIQS